MASAFIGEIRLVGFNFPPQGWATCNGALQSIAQNTALFALLGTTYGGDGLTTFALPDLRGRMPIHMGQSPGTSNYTIGESAGTESVTLISSQLPLHNHPTVAAAGGSDTDLSSGMPASGGPDLYATGGGGPTITVMPTGGNQPHENMAPFVAMNFVIALFGIFPARN